MFPMPQNPTSSPPALMLGRLHALVVDNPACAPRQLDKLAVPVTAIADYPALTGNAYVLSTARCRP